MKLENAAWRYHKNTPEGRIFQAGETVPKGWVDHPDKINDKVKKTKTLEEEIDDIAGEEGEIE